MLQDHGQEAGALCGALVYAPTFAGTNWRCLMTEGVAVNNMLQAAAWQHSQDIPVKLDFLGIDDVAKQTERLSFPAITRSPMQYTSKVVA